MRLVLVVLIVAVAWACEAETPTADPDRPGDDLVPAVVAEPMDPPGVQTSEEPPPSELVVEELTEADGPRVGEETDVVTVHLLAHGWSSGTVITSSWERGTPRTIALDGAIGGFREGIAGMAVGERRRIVVPPELGYGEDPPPILGERETIVFVVDLLGVE